MIKLFIISSLTLLAKEMAKSFKYPLTALCPFSKHTESKKKAIIAFGCGAQKSGGKN